MVFRCSYLTISESVFGNDMMFEFSDPKENKEL